MGLKYKRAELDWSIRALARANAQFKGWIGEEMEDVAAQVQSLMVMYSDLQKNRISGDMVGAMRAEVSGTRTQLRFGFIDGAEDYYRYQTVTGFTHWLSGKYIAPSLALSDAKIDAEQLMRAAQIRVRNRFMAAVSR